MLHITPSKLDCGRNTHLEVEVHALSQVGLLRVALVLAHVETESVVAVRGLALRQEHGVVEAQVLAARQTLQKMTSTQCLATQVRSC